MATITKRPRADGTARWRVQIRRHGAPPLSATFDRKTDAQDWAARVETEIRTGRYLSDAQDRTLNELITRYSAEASRRLKSWHGVEYRLDLWRARLGHLRLCQVSSARIAEVRDELAATPTKFNKPRSGADVNRFLAALSSAMTHAVRELDWLESNPVMRVRRLKEAPARCLYLDREEFGRVMAAARRAAHPDLLLAILLAVTTGARRSEILGLRWTQVDLDRRSIVLHSGQTKNDQARLLPIADEVWPLLAQRRAADPAATRVFPPPRGGKMIKLDEVWKEVLVEAGIEVVETTAGADGSDGPRRTSLFRWHDLRHTAGSHLTMSGASAIEVTRMLGHKTLAMSLRYAHLAPDRAGELSNRLAQRIGLSASRP
jgi:integrase